MATPAKIKQHELDQMITEGKSTSEIAAHFGCTPGAVSQAKRRLGVALANEAAAPKHAPMLVEKKETAMDRLLDLADRCNNELVWIEQTVPPSTDEEYRQWQDTKIKHAAEIRKLITAMADIRVKIYHAETVEKALKIMFEEIGNESPECQKRIGDRLRKSSIYLELDG
jgi:transposase-like protein